MTLSSTIIVLGHFANFKLAGDRAVRDAVHLLQRDAGQNGHVHTIPSLVPRAPLRTRRRRRGTKSRHMHRSTRVNVMSDADLEAELASRRAMRARERERYARAMRSEKLSVLEGELMRLRSEISRMDRPAVGSGTPPNTRWEALPGARSSVSRGTLPTAPVPASSLPSHVPSSLAAPPGPSGPPPPPPPSGMTDDEQPIDPERQKREKEERVKRREAKRKEREQAKKPLTLAEIIRGAGPDPMRRLKPSGSTSLPDVHEPEEAKEDFADVLSSLKKTDDSDKAVDSEKTADSGKTTDSGKAADRDKAANLGPDKTADADKNLTGDGGRGGYSLTNDSEEGRRSDSVHKSRSESVAPDNTKKVGSNQRDRGEPDGSDLLDEIPGSLEEQSSVDNDSKSVKFGASTSKVTMKSVEKETEANGDQKNFLKEEPILTAWPEDDVKKNVEENDLSDQNMGKDVKGNDVKGNDVENKDGEAKDVHEIKVREVGVEDKDVEDKDVEDKDMGDKDVEDKDANGKGTEGNDASEMSAASMLLAVSAIAAKLPSSQVANTSVSTKTGDTRKPPLPGGQKRLSLEQRRQLRRDTSSAAKVSSDGLSGGASVDTSNVRTE